MKRNVFDILMMNSMLSVPYRKEVLEPKSPVAEESDTKPITVYGKTMPKKQYQKRKKRIAMQSASRKANR